MYMISAEKKGDPVKRWNLPDRVFFACGACHILAYAFMRRYAGYSAFWVKPARGFTGNHIFVARGDAAFDYHGHVDRETLLSHMVRKARLFWPGWDYELTPLPAEVLISERKSRAYDGLWLRGPGQFLHNAMPRAERFLDQISPLSPAFTKGERHALQAD